MKRESPFTTFAKPQPCVRELSVVDIMSLWEMRKVTVAVPLFLLIKLFHLMIFFQECKFPASNDREWSCFLISRKWVRTDERLASRYQLPDSGWKYRVGEWPSLDGLPPEYKSAELPLNQSASFALVVIVTYTSRGSWPFQRLINTNVGSTALRANFEAQPLDLLHWWSLVCR